MRKESDIWETAKDTMCWNLVKKVKTLGYLFHVKHTIS